MEQSQNITHIIKNIEQALLVRYNDQYLCQQYAWWMLQAITKKTHTQLLAHQTVQLTAQQKAQLYDWIDRLVIDHKPLAYILGKTPFSNLEILIEPPILIPRPETEEWVIAFIEQLQKKISEQTITILDLCSGSGCIGLAFAKAFPRARIYAVDISPIAIELGKKNASHNGVTNITFIQSDLFTAIPEGLKFDIIVSNPPYIAQSEYEQLDPAVSKWEDKNALVAPDNGLELIEKIIIQAQHYIKSSTTTIQQLGIEIGYQQGPQVFQFMKSHGYTNVQVNKDLQGNDRFVTGRINRVAQTGS